MATNDDPVCDPVSALLLSFAPTLGVAKNTIIVITFYSTSCLDQETAKGPFGLRVKLPTELSFILLRVMNKQHKPAK